MSSDRAAERLGEVEADPALAEVLRLRDRLAVQTGPGYPIDTTE